MKASERLGNELKRLGMKQVELARKTGKRPETVNRWVRGKLPVPDWIWLYLGLPEKEEKKVS